MSEKYRLVTRSDFDGLVCAALLKEMDMVDDILFVHPKDMQDGKIDIGARDITANLPFVPGAAMVFDHHASETGRVDAVGESTTYINIADAPSAAQVIYQHFGSDSRFQKVNADMMAAVNKADSAQFSEKDILNPEGWELLSFLMDSRTGLGRFRTFRISNYQLMMELIDMLLETSIEDILDHPDVKERVEVYKDHQEKHKEQIKRCSKVHSNLVVVDMREEETIYAGNRFVVYGLYPWINISATVLWGLKKQNVVFAIGKSIINRTSQTNVGELCLKYGGGGHVAAGTCQIPTPEAEKVMEELVTQITKDG